MTAKECADITKDVIRKAKRLILEAERTINTMVFDKIIIPHLKEWGMTLRWRMGSVFAADKYGREIDDRDPRIKLLVEKVEGVLEGIDILQDKRCHILWWVLCEQSFEALDLNQKPVPWYYDDSIPSICDRNIKFEDLKIGDYVYILDYDQGDVTRAVIKDTKTSKGTTHISFLEGEYDALDVDSTRFRSGRFFTNYKAAERSVELLATKLSAFYYFYFKPEPEVIVRQLLA